MRKLQSVKPLLKIAHTSCICITLNGLLINNSFLVHKNLIKELDSIQNIQLYQISLTPTNRTAVMIDLDLDKEWTIIGEQHTYP